MKRIFDLLISLPATVILLPFFAVLVTAIRLSSKGPAIFKQQRAGKNGKPFIFYKFRTMKTDDDSLEILSMAVDKQAQGKGAGRALVERVVKESSKRHIRKIRVMVGEPLPANEFYKQLGFKYLAQHSTHGHWANIYVMNVDIDY